MTCEIRGSRRQFLTTSAAALLVSSAGTTAATGTAARHAQASASGRTQDDRPGRRRRNRVGAVAYGYQYSIGLFSYRDRPGERFDAVRVVEAVRQAGGEVLQLYYSMIDKLDEAGLARLRRRAQELDVMLEVHGGGALRRTYERAMHKAAAVGAKVIGCSFGMLMRPEKIATLKLWDEHVARCEARLRELVPVAKSLKLTIGVENHLDFTVEELRDLIRRVDSPRVGVIFDVGNTVGTLDDPIEAADILGPYTVATHYKDFAIEEVTRGFRITMVPLGCGSLRLREITERLLKHIDPEMGLSIEMMNGQHFEVKWLEDRFWVPYRNKTARQVAATLRHIRGKAIDIDEFILQEEVDKLPHEEHIRFEQERMTRCIAYLKGLLDDVQKRPPA